MEMTQSKKKNTRWIWIALILLLVSLFLYRSVYRTAAAFLGPENRVWDLDYWRAIGALWLDGEAPYGCQVYASYVAEYKGLIWDCYPSFYPPWLIAAFSLLAKVSRTTAFWVFYSLNISLVFVLLWMVGKILSKYMTIGLPEIALLSSLLLTGFRTNIKYSQLSLYEGVFLFAFFILLQNKRQTSAGVALALASLRPTTLPLFLIYVLIKKHYRTLVTALILIVMIWGLPLLLTGRPIVDSAVSYITNYAYHNTGIDNVSPFFPDSATQYQLPIILFRLFNSNAAVVELLSWGIVLALCFLSFRVISRDTANQHTELLDFAIVSVLTMSYIYHRSYDAFLFFPAVLIFYILARRETGNGRRLLWIGALLVIILGDALPSNISVTAIDYMPQLAESYLFRLLAPVKAWLSFLLLLSLLWLRYRLPGLEISLHPIKSDSDT